LSRVVCRTCWTWYANGESVCPKCRTRLVGATQNQTEVTPTPATVQPTADAPFPTPVQSSSSGISWPQWLLIGGGALAGIVVIGLIVTGLLLTGALGPVTSTDGVVTVKVPKGWAQTHATLAANGKPVLVLARLKTTNGIEPHFIVADSGSFIPLSELEVGWQQFVESGKFPIAGSLGSLKRTTIAGAPALSVDFRGSQAFGQILFVDYGSKTYVIEMTSDPTEFARLRDTDFAAILSSWEWH
jgi:hypothetical protein